MPWNTDEDVMKHKKNLSKKGMAQWRRIANSVLKKCMAKGGDEKTCAASAIRQANGVVNNNSSKYSTCTNKQEVGYEIELKVHQEKAYLVVPVVMIMEGVMAGSHGPLLHKVEDFGKFPEAWNGIPVVIDHPEEEGVNVSANSPEIIDSRTVGRVYNTHVKDSKLVAEVWLDEEKLNQVSPDTLAHINQGNPIEVSVGVFTEQEEEEGEWNGIEYKAIARNHRPDHLALLTECIGACSLADGCGIRANKKREKDMPKNVNEMINNLSLVGYSINQIGDYKKQGYKELMDAIYNCLRSMDSEGKYHYLEELYDDSLVYQFNTKGESKLYKQDYQVTSGVVELTGSPVEVHKKVEYIVSNSLTRTKFSINNKKEDKKMSRGNDCPKCLEKINALIANEQSKFVEADRELLLTLDESVLDKLAPVVKEVEKIVEKTVEINKLTPEQTADLAFLAKQRVENRNKMIQTIQANTSKELWPDAEFKVLSEDQIKRILDSVKKEEVVDYSLQGDGLKANAGEEEAMYPVELVMETKSK